MSSTVNTYDAHHDAHHPIIHIIIKYSKYQIKNTHGNILIFRKVNNTRTEMLAL